VKLGLALVSPPVSHETVERRTRVLEVIRERGPITIGDIHAIVPGRIADDVVRLQREGAITRTPGCSSSATYQLAGLIPPAPKSEPRRLPMLEIGEGDRDNACDHYSGCLARWFRHPPPRPSRAERARLGVCLIESYELPAQCPPACAWRSHEGAELERLHVAASRPGSFAAP
jgi:hypothetical protein